MSPRNRYPNVRAINECGIPGVDIEDDVPPTMSPLRIGSGVVVAGHRRGGSLTFVTRERD
jgi:hypothetical protein